MNARPAVGSELLEQRLLLTTAPVGEQFLVAESFGLAENPPAIAVRGDGAFTSVWSSYDEDGSGSGIFGQRFDADGLPLSGLKFQVNTQTLGEQSAPAIATDAAGNVLVVWQSKGQDGSGYGVYGQWYTSGGVAQGNEFRINSSTTGDQMAPAVAIDGAGVAIVAWQGADSDGWGIYYARVSSLSDVADPEVQANIATAGAQQNPTIAAAANGNIVIAWEAIDPLGGSDASLDIYARVFSDTDPVPGGEFRVNSETLRDQVTPDAAIDADGDFVIVWVGGGIPGSGSDVFGQRFSELAVAQGTQFRVNNTTLASQVSGVVDSDANGNFLVSWQSVHQDGFSEGIFGRHYDANGATLVDEFLVNTVTEGPQTTPAISINGSGRAVVAWRGKNEDHQSAVFAQRFQAPNSSLVDLKVGGEIPLGTFVELQANGPGVVMDNAGNSVVVWESFEQDGEGMGIYAQRLDNFGDPIGAPFLVNTAFTAGNQGTPAVAGSGGGAFVVTWQSQGQDGSGYGIYGQRYLADGTADGPAFLVNTTTVGDQTSPAIAMGDDGQFVIVWQGMASDGSTNIYGRRYDAFGTAVDVEFQVNNQEVLDQVSPVIAMNALGEFAVAWVSSHPAATIPELDAEKSVFVQWFNAEGVATGDEVLAHVYVKDAQESPAIGIDAAGNFVVAWQSIGQDGSTWGVYARQFLRDKSPVQAQEFLVNETTGQLQRNVGVGVEADGNFVITWESTSLGTDDGSSTDIYRREYFADGTPDGGENLVNTWTAGPQTLPVVARAATGNYGIFWSGQGFSHVDGVHGRLYDVNLSDDPGTPSRIPVTDQFLVGATLGFENSAPAIAVNADGSITLAFETFEEDGSGFGVFAERFHADGTPIEGSRVQVNFVTQDDQSAPSIATDGSGNILVVWQSKDGEGFGVFGQWFTLSSTDGTLVKSGTEFRINSTTAGDQTRPDVAMDTSGRAVIAWQSANQDGSGLGVYFTRLDFPGDTTGIESRVNDTTAGDQQLPTVAAAAASGQFVIAWQGPGPLVEGEASVEVFAKRFTVAGAEAGTEFQVNATAAKDQIAPDVAMDSDGDAVFVWQAEGQQSSGSDVYARRMDSTGVLQGVTDTRVNTTVSRPQRAPSVAMDASGNSLISWQSQHQDGFSWGVYGHEYAADGTSLATEFAINERVEGPQTSPSVAMNPAGQALVAWLGNDSTHVPAVSAHRYAVPNVEPGLSVGTEFKLTNFLGLEETPPAAAMNANREAVVVWTSYAEDGSGMGVFAQMLDRQGLPLGGKFAVNSFTTGNQSTPAIARNAAGQFVIAWQSEAEDGDGYAVFAQVYSSAGAAVSTTPFLVNTTTAGDQMAPAVAMADDGSFVIVWQSTSTDGSLDVMGQRYDSSGNAVGTEFRVNNFTGLDQKDPAIAMNGAGQFVVAWVSDHPALTDPLDTEKSIFAQWFNAAGDSTGDEVLVHRFVKDAQEAPAVGIDPSGRFVVAWQSINQDGNSWGVFARRFNADKSAVERREFVVNESRQGPQRYVGVGMDAFGRIVITWQTNSRAELAGGGSQSTAAADSGNGGSGGSGSGAEGSSWEIYSRQYHFSGRAEGGETLVNQWQMGPQIRPVVAQAPGGDFGLFWLGQGPDHIEGVHGRLYQGQFDFGDAPDSLGPDSPQYPTLLVNDGPRHLPGSGLTLGTNSDAELDGQPNVNATGDDTDAKGDDEDGVLLPSLLIRETTATVTVNASAPGKLDAWIDFNRNGAFDADEQIADTVDLVAGANALSFVVPATAVTGASIARFRISSAGGLAPTGLAVDGEIEDHKVDIIGSETGSAKLVDDPDNPGLKILLINGTGSNDSITVSPKRGGVVEVVRNKRSWGKFSIAQISRIVVLGKAGNDTIKVDSRITVPATIYGEAGNDRLYGGSGNDFLFGGEGNDSLYGNRGQDQLRGGNGNDLLRGGADNDSVFGDAGDDKLYADSGSDLLMGGNDNDFLYGGTSRDFLIGGSGIDYLNGGGADDILVGASTVHDSQIATLQAILNDWRSELAFGTRVTQLGTLLSSATVIGDGLRDTLYGSSGRDWLLDFELLDDFLGFNSDPATGDQKN